jgi:hypothetical protein
MAEFNDDGKIDLEVLTDLHVSNRSEYAELSLCGWRDGRMYGCAPQYFPEVERRILPIFGI